MVVNTGTKGEPWDPPLTNIEPKGIKLGLNPWLYPHPISTPCEAYDLHAVRFLSWVGGFVFSFFFLGYKTKQNSRKFFSVLFFIWTYSGIKKHEFTETSMKMTFGTNENMCKYKYLKKQKNKLIKKSKSVHWIKFHSIKFHSIKTHSIKTHSMNFFW